MTSSAEWVIEHKTSLLILKYAKRAWLSYPKNRIVIDAYRRSACWIWHVSQSTQTVSRYALGAISFPHGSPDVCCETSMRSTPMFQIVFVQLTRDCWSKRSRTRIALGLFANVCVRLLCKLRTATRRRIVIVQKKEIESFFVRRKKRGQKAHRIDNENEIIADAGCACAALDRLW